MEEMIFQLITYSGGAKSSLLEGIQIAKTGDIVKAKAKIAEAEAELALAHKTQTQLIQNEAGGQATPVSLLLIHAQDHLMNAILLKDLANEFIDLYAIVKA